MDSYVLLKFIHIVCSMLLVGTGFGIAFFMLMASLTKNIAVIASTARFVVMADWIFTAPAIVGQMVTGFLLMKHLHYSFSAPWFWLVISLFIFVGCCWLPVVFIQYKLKGIAAAAEITGVLDKRFFGWIKLWITLGVPAFVSVLIIAWLMVAKPLAVV